MTFHAARPPQVPSKPKTEHGNRHSGDREDDAAHGEFQFLRAAVPLRGRLGLLLQSFTAQAALAAHVRLDNRLAVQPEVFRVELEKAFRIRRRRSLVESPGL